MRIFFGDLVHDWEKVSVWTIPLNIGLVASYTKKIYPDAEVRLFKHPEEMIKAIRQESPDVVALAYYAWNPNLNNLMLKLTKEHDPNILTVGGGPTVTNLTFNVEGGTAFFKYAPDCDTYVINQGEKGFVEIINRFIEVDGNLAKLKREPIEGCLTNDMAHGIVMVGEKLTSLDSLDEIPSPYLNGMLDPFLEKRYIPLLETNRNCPYQCTFCAFGVGDTKLLKFDLDRVFAEIDHIASSTKADYLITTDTNFGIIERDKDIAKKIHEAHMKYGFPGILCVVWNKSLPDRVRRVAKEFKGLAQVGASMQSLSSEVLTAIKRKNITLDNVTDIRDEVQTSSDAKLFSELISGLPTQTLASHIEDNKRLMDTGAEVFNYGMRFLLGTEMDTKESREKYYKRTGWRLQDDAFGVYDGVTIFEGEELAQESTTMSHDDFRLLRVLHFFLQFMWGKKFFLDFLMFFKGLGIHPMDMVRVVAEEFDNATGSLVEIRERFMADYQLEQFETYEEMHEYWSIPENLERLREGGYGKLNASYGFELLRHLDDFVDFLASFSGRMIEEIAPENVELAKRQCSAILTFTKARHIHLDGENAIENFKPSQSPFDIVGWRNAGHKTELLNEENEAGYRFEFHTSERQLAGLEKQMKFFKSENIELTLRKMFDVNPYDFYYSARPIGGEEPVEKLEATGWR